jgi:peptide/nickel transport system substrate-binding protein/oligopeptide transport system substrate-binding protein
VPLDGSPTATSPPPIFAPSDDVLTVAIQEPSTLDPMRLQDPGGVLVARQLFEGLTAWDPVEEEVVPAAAESWEVSDGGRTFTFTLRQGMTFHDGTPVTSKDFAFAFDRIAAKANASDLAYTLEDIQGFIAVNQLGDAKHLSGVRTPDPTTLVIELDEPFYDFPVVLTHPSLVPVPASAVADEDRFLTTPVGNGPFNIAQSWSPGDPILLKAFLGFYDTPEIDGIRFLSYPDAAASWLPFINKDIDIAEVPAGEIEGARESYGDQGYKPFLATYSFGLNVSSPQLDDIRMRRAINKAIDRQTIVQTVYRGTMTLPRGIVPEGMPGFHENLCVDLCEYAPDEAKELVGRLKKADRHVALDYSGAQPHPRIARLVKEDLEKAGLDVTLHSYPFPKYLKRLRDKDHAMYRLGWIAEYPTPDAFLTPLFDAQSPDNHSGISSSKVDALLERARSTASEGKRVQLYIEAEKAIMENVPIAPIGSFVAHWAAQPRVIGFVFDQTGGFDALGIELAPE